MNIPSLIAGRYELQSPIGEGGMGRVYLAHDRQTESAVALKLLRPEFAHDEQFRRAFADEASMAARLDHPNIVRVLDYGAESDAVYIVMEHIDGPDLRVCVRERGRIPWREALGLGIQLADALVCAHRHGVIHLDVKSSNCVVERSATGPEHVRLVDFGLAQLRTPPPGDGQRPRMGTPASMAPEQILGEAVSFATDVYGLGQTLHELISGSPPFTGPDADAVMHRIVHEAPASIKGPPEVPNCPLRLELTIAQALEKRPEDRFVDMQSFRDELALCLQLADARLRRRAPTQLGTAFGGERAAEIDAPQPMPRFPATMMSAPGTPVSGPAAAALTYASGTRNSGPSPSLAPTEDPPAIHVSTRLDYSGPLAAAASPSATPDSPPSPTPPTATAPTAPTFTPAYGLLPLSREDDADPRPRRPLWLLVCGGVAVWIAALGVIASAGSALGERALAERVGQFDGASPWTTLATMLDSRPAVETSIANPPSPPPRPPRTRGPTAADPAPRNERLRADSPRAASEVQVEPPPPAPHGPRVTPEHSEHRGEAIRGRRAPAAPQSFEFRSHLRASLASQDLSNEVDQGETGYELEIQCRLRSETQLGNRVEVTRART